MRKCKSQFEILQDNGFFEPFKNVLFCKPSIFVFYFVYSPFCKPDSWFKTELGDWLSFIRSSFKITRHNLPQVLVVILDKYTARSKSLTWAHSIVDEINKRFAIFLIFTLLNSSINWIIHFTPWSKSSLGDSITEFIHTFEDNGEGQSSHESTILDPAPLNGDDDVGSRPLQWSKLVYHLI